MTPWTQTASGRAFPLLDPTPADVHWPDIARHLAHINRYSGAAGRYSVAQHSCLVADLMPRQWRAYGLLHDAHEAYLGDITTPVVAALDYVGADTPGRSTRALKDIADAAIHAAAQLPWPPPLEVRNAVREADVVALMTERRDLLGRSPRPWADHFEAVQPLAWPIARWPDSDFDETMWLAALRRETGIDAAGDVVR